MMNKQNSFEKYVNQTGTLDRFNEKNPTLSHKRKDLAAPHNGVKFASVETVENFGGSILHFAGMNFLESIHTEINSTKPSWVKDAEENEALNERKRKEAIEDAAVLGL